MLIDTLLAGETEIFWNALGHIILPAIILAYMAMAYITRMTRAFTLEQLSQDYVIAARAKGVSPARTITRHVLPNIAVQAHHRSGDFLWKPAGRRRGHGDRILLARYRPIHDECAAHW